MKLKMFACSVNDDERQFTCDTTLQAVIEANEEAFSPEELAEFTADLEATGKATLLGCVGSYAEFEKVAA